MASIEENQLPVFKPSGRGLHADLQTVTLEEQRGAGWWKGQIKKYLNILAPPILVDGIECYDNSFTLGSDSCVEESTGSAITGQAAMPIADYGLYIDSVQAISNGSFKIYLNSKEFEATGLNFAGVQTAQDIADVISSKLEGASISSFQALINGDTLMTMQYSIVTDKLGDTSSISQLEQASSGTFISFVLFMNPGTITQGITIPKSDVERFLDLLGLDEDGYIELCNTYNSSKVSNVKFGFKEKYTFEEKDFDFIYDKISQELSLVRSVEISYVETYELVDEPAIITTAKFERFPNLYNSELEHGRPTVIMYDELDVDITSTIESSIKIAVGSMLFCSGSKLFLLDTVSESRVYYSDGGIDYVDITITETYNYPLLTAFNDEYDSYNVSEKYIYDIDDNTQYAWIEKYANDFWRVRDSFALIDGPVDEDGLFIRSGDEIYLTVEGLEYTNVNDFAYYLGQFSEFIVIQDGVPWYKRLLNTVLGLFIGLINLVSVIAVNIPVVRIQIQALVWIFGGQEWVTDKDELIKYSNSIFTTALIAILSIPSGGTQYPALTALINVATVAINVDQLEKDIEFEKNLLEIEELERLEKELEKDTEDMDIEGNDNYGTENQFMVLDRMMESQDYEKFEDDSMFEIKY